MPIELHTLAKLSERFNVAYGELLRIVSVRGIEPAFILDGRAYFDVSAKLQIEAALSFGPHHLGPAEARQ